MSKRKHFHSIGSGKKMFQYAALNGAGLRRRFPPKKKNAPSPANTGEETRPRTTNELVVHKG